MKRLALVTSISFLIVMMLLSGCAPTDTPTVLSPDHTTGMNLLLICLDTLRADRLGSYGYDLPTSPFMDMVSKNSIVMPDVLAQNPSTILSHRAIFTGHYVFRQTNGPAPAETTMAGRLADVGYATAAFTDGGLMSERFGNDPGFQLYNHDAGGTKKVFQRGLDWLDSRSDQPFFMFLHTYDIHYPYTPPAPFDKMFLPDGEPPYHLGDKHGQEYWNDLDLTREEFIWLSRRYDGGVRHTDRDMMKLWMELQRRGLLDNTIVIVLSDHGESLGERLFVGHREPYDVQIHVPLIMVIPGWQGRVLDGAVETVDLLPTVLDLLSIPSDTVFCGKSLADKMYGETHESRYRPRLSETWMRAFRLGPEQKIILADTPENDELYFLDTDPEESNNVVSSHPEIADELRRAVSEFTGIPGSKIRDHSGRTKVPVMLMSADSEPEDVLLMEQLRQLGYMQ
jgi:arylsulfatase